MDPLPSRDLDMEGQPGTANQSGDGNRIFANFGGSQKNIEGSSYESGGVMNIVNNINRVSAEESAASSKGSRVIPLPRNEDIVDRTHISAQLDALLPPKSNYQSAASTASAVPALEYAYNRCRDPACSVFWVHADNETTFAQDYKSIARRLGLANLDGEKPLTAVRERIESGPPWLLVLDNADDLALFGVGLPSHNTSSGRPEELMSLYNYVPSSGTGTVLWTSRDERIVGTLVGSRRGIQVGPMSPGEAKILLGTSRNEEVASKEAVDGEKLLQELQWLPLAISQAGAYLRRTSTPITEYLSKLAEGKQRWQTLKETEFDRHRRPNVPNNVLETWNISIEHIRRENKMAYRIMHIIAYVNNQDIPFEIMTAAGLFGDEGGVGDSSQNKDRVVKAVIRLKEFSFLGFLRGVDDTRSYEMHKLVQEATRYGLGVRNPENEIHFSGAALQIMAKLFSRAQARNMGRVREVHRARGTGGWREMEPVDQRAYELRRAVLGEKHPYTIRSMASLATTYHQQGRYAEAEPIYIKVLELRREVLGEKHPYTIRSMADLVATYHQQGRDAEAEPMKIKVLELRREAASSGGHEEMVQMLLDKGAEVNAQGGDYGNALQAASSGGHWKIVQMLLDKGAEVNAQGGYYGNALQAASSGGHGKIVQMLLDKGAEVNAQGGYYDNALQAASSEGHEEVVQMLLDKGAEVNAQGGVYGNALQAASSEGHKKVVQMLLEKGAEVNAQGGHYGNALQAASSEGHEKVVQMLLEKGAEVNAQSGVYGNALQAASSKGHEEVVQMLLDKGAEVNAQGGHYGNALQAASFKGHEKVVQMLLEKGAEVNAQGGDYGNALQEASFRGHEKVVQMLLEKGVEVNAQGG
ncbi:ankyrin repeat-containing domain protein [Rhypophila decipiens]|uniref:Ankyrin repeat-containing domain protein n=1 Tax=Rhypophila decipiens TaxID=261697 RepID=A0AAN6XUP3_9PEZI|nr:ankyrin repeat-containing domain protein [Rhypophila decipiens]